MFCVSQKVPHTQCNDLNMSGFDFSIIDVILLKFLIITEINCHFNVIMESLSPILRSDKHIIFLE